MDTWEWCRIQQDLKAQMYEAARKWLICCEEMVLTKEIPLRDKLYLEARRHLAQTEQQLGEWYLKACKTQLEFEETALKETEKRKS